MATGVGSTLLLTETKNQTLEDLSNERQEGFVEGVVAPVEIRDGVVIDAAARR
jgi:PHS family inorganic phosphate transporter-like MFS transporter